MNSIVKPLYQATMVVFYSVCRFGWNLYMKYQDRFEKFSEEYTKEYGQAALKAIDAAQALPDAAKRRSNTKKQGIELDTTSVEALAFWKKLRRYIIKCYPKAEANVAVEQAGGTHFAKAAAGNLSEITQLMSEGELFINENLDVLTAVGKMPAGFAADFGTTKTNFEENHIDYGKIKGDGKDGTTGKIEANNALYTSLLMMFGDAASIFEQERSIAKQFTFAAVRRLVTNSIGGIHFLALVAGTKTPVNTAVVTVVSGDGTQTTASVDDKGVLDVKTKAGVYTVTVNTPGYNVLTQKVTVSAGVMHRAYLPLQKASDEESVG